MKRVFAACMFLVILVLATWSVAATSNSLFNDRVNGVAKGNRAKSRAAFLAALPVMRHPRCMNCHSSGDYPRQGDDGHVHAQNVRRGPDGRGKYGEKCSACHQEQNVEGLNMPPGAPSWHLPPANMPMIWEGKTAGQICRQLKDAKQNGGRSIAQIIDHIANDRLVLWGWSPGEGRSTPPLSHNEFAHQLITWARYGSACPE